MGARRSDPWTLRSAPSTTLRWTTLKLKPLAGQEKVKAVIIPSVSCHRWDGKRLFLLGREFEVAGGHFSFLTRFARASESNSRSVTSRAVWNVTARRKEWRSGRRRKGRGKMGHAALVSPLPSFHSGTILSYSCATVCPAKHAYFNYSYSILAI